MLPAPILSMFPHAPACSQCSHIPLTYNGYLYGPLQLFWPLVRIFPIQSTVACPKHTRAHTQTHTRTVHAHTSRSVQEPMKPASKTQRRRDNRTGPFKYMLLGRGFSSKAKLQAHVRERIHAMPLYTELTNATYPTFFSLLSRLLDCHGEVEEKRGASGVRAFEVRSNRMNPKCTNIISRPRRC